MRKEFTEVAERISLQEGAALARGFGGEYDPASHSIRRTAHRVAREIEGIVDGPGEKLAADRAHGLHTVSGVAGILGVGVDYRLLDEMLAPGYPVREVSAEDRERYGYGADLPAKLINAVTGLATRQLPEHGDNELVKRLSGKVMRTLYYKPDMTEGGLLESLEQRDADPSLVRAEALAPDLVAALGGVLVAAADATRYYMNRVATRAPGEALPTLEVLHA